MHAELPPLLVYSYVKLFRRRLEETGDDEDIDLLYREVIYSEILTYMIFLDLKIEYDTALSVLRDP